MSIAIVKFRSSIPDPELAGRFVKYCGQRYGRKSIAVQFRNDHEVRFYPIEFLDMDERYVGETSDLDVYPHAGEKKGHHPYKGHGRYTYTEDDAASPLFGQF